MGRVCPVEVPCVSSPVPPPLRCCCTVCLARAVQWGGWPLAVCYLPLKGQSRLGCQVPSTGVYPGVCGVASPGQMANVAPDQPEAYPDARCLCPGRYIHGPPNVVPRLPPSHWPMNMPEGAAGVRSPGKYSARAGAGLGSARRGLVAWDCRRLDLVVSCSRGCSRL